MAAAGVGIALSKKKKDTAKPAVKTTRIIHRRTPEEETGDEGDFPSLEDKTVFVETEDEDLIKVLKIKPRRSILYLFPSSEESGLFGSAYYCEHPAVPLEKTVACLNFESIGPAPLTKDVVILGGGQSILDQYYVDGAIAQGRYIFFDDDDSDGWFYRSDHYNFVKKGVPAVVMENGRELADPSKPDKYPMASWYHKPCDEYREDWDLEGTLANIHLVINVALSLAFSN